MKASQLTVQFSSVKVTLAFSRPPVSQAATRPGPLRQRTDKVEQRPAGEVKTNQSYEGNILWGDRRKRGVMMSVRVLS